MKRKLFFLLLFGWLLTPLGVGAAGPVKFFCIELRNGSKAEFALSTQPQISFSNGSMTATTTEKTITAALSDVVSYTFSEKSISTSISMPTKQRTGKPQVDYSAGHIRLSGLTAETTVSIVTMNGQQIFKGHSSPDGMMDIDLSLYPTGIYMICTPNGNVKVAVGK